ncbi:Ig-like domain-containing protein [Aeromonas encheleia]|uniref:beta strand repeat-containing protein n=1 Tax=Aeromonas encheleia TaxID=73010 RepID=UPI001F5AB643|nr:Ig-like domain-containing protein [Aeromonas encheleia]UNP88217.1 Ig-like domain-containing protein [Aeromonas encheleia]
MSKPMNVFLSLFLTLFLFSCGGGGGGGSDAPDPGAKTLTKIDISADTAGTKARAEANPSTPLGISTQYSAIATYSDNTTEDITALATWSSADTSIATIDEKGLAKPLKISKTEITASYQGVTSNASTLTITDAIATKISVIPPTTKVAKGLSLQLQAIATLSDDSTKDVSTQASWQSNNPAVLEVDTQGKITARDIGDATVSATLQGVTGQTSVSAVNLAISQIQITPATVTLAIGTKTKLTALATLADQSVQDVSSQVGWLSSNPAVATIDGTGQVTGVAAGTVTLSASLLGVTATTSVTVNNTSASTLQVIPAASSIALGTKTQLQAIATFQDGSTQDVSEQVQWSSSDTTLADINSVGLVTSKGIGQVTLSATLGAISRSATLTVTNAITTSIQITPAAKSLPKGTKQQFQAIATFSDNSSQDLTSQVDWDSSDINVATIDLNGEATAFNEGNTIISAKFQNVTSNASTLEVTGATLNAGGLTITVPPLTLAAGLTGQLAANGSYSDGSSVNVTTSVSWTSSDPAVATVDASGLVTGVTPGTATITGTLDGQSATLSVTVTNATLNVGGLTITVPPMTLAVGLTGQLAASGTYSDGTSADVTANVQWSSDPAIATVSLTGLVTAVAPGTATITGILDGQSATLSVTVTNATINAGGLTITVPPMTLAAGQTGQLAANGSYSDGSSVDVTASVSWVSSDPAVATVDASGLVTGVAPGTATITGTLGGQSATLSVTVSNAVLNAGGLTIATPPLTLAAGLTGQLVANGSYSDGSNVNVTTSVSWTSSNPAVASVGLHTGLVTAVAPGIATITGTLNGETATLLVTVTNAAINPGGLTITVPPLTLAAGLTGQLVANGSYSDGSNLDVTANVSWTSSAPAVATVGLNTGLVTAVVPGTATITGTLGGQTATLQVTVTNAILNPFGLSITVPPLTLAAGLTGQLAANGSYSDGSNINVTNSVSWSSGTPAVATVSSTGLVTAVTPGVAVITGTLNGQNATLLITVTSAALNPGGLNITVPPLTLAAGLTGQLTAQGSYSDGSTVDVTANVSWTSSAPAIASVGLNSGLVTALQPGTATITGTLNGESATLGVTVSNAVVVSVAIAPISPLAAGTSTQLKVTATLSDTTTQDVSAQANWLSSNPGVFSVTSTGLATGVTVGSANVSVNVQGVTASLPVTVSNAVLSSLVISSTSSINLLNTVRTITFTAIGHYSDGSTQNVTSSATWRMNGGLLALGLGNTYVLVIPLGSTNFQAELNGVSSNILTFPGLIP